jgi:AcrR family transcriptional regulator
MVTTPIPAESPERRRDAERTRRDILDVATREFAQQGYAGARIDEIAAQTRTTKRMIYYYFGGKEQLYIAALERVYSMVREAERGLDVDHLDPVAAIRRLAELTFDHHESHPDFIKLVSIENIHEAQLMAKSGALSELNTTAVTVTAKILARGYEEGVFRRQVDALDVHMIISAFCFFRVANRHTFRTLFGRDLLDGELRGRHRQMVGDLVVDYLTAEVAS